MQRAAIHCFQLSLGLMTLKTKYVQCVNVKKKNSLYNYTDVLRKTVALCPPKASHQAFDHLYPTQRGVVYSRMAPPQIHMAGGFTFGVPESRIIHNNNNIVCK